MRFVLIALVALAACEDDGPLDSEKDMTVTHDLSVVGTTCAAAVQCSMACGADTSCSAACFTNVSAAAMPYSMALLNCIQMKCTSLGGDAGTMDCDNPSLPACNTCVQGKCFAEASACIGH